MNTAALVDADQAAAVLAQLDADLEAAVLAQHDQNERAAAESEADLQWRTLADIDDTPPGDLLLDMLEPEGPTLPYGTGGVGKGSTVAWWIRELLRSEGMKSMIYDAENRPKEWARRTSGLGVDRSEVVYVQPADLTSSLVGRPLWDVVPHLGAVARASGADILFVDSILAAMNVSEEALKSDAGAPYRVVGALDSIGIPTVALGHTRKGATDGDPFGSVSWVNAFRLTWLATPAEGDGHRVRWAPRKRNERGAIGAVLLTFRYDEGGRLSEVVREDDETNIRQWLTDALVEGPRTVDELAEERAVDAEDYTAALTRSKEHIRKTLGRMRRAGLVHKPKGRNTPWSLGAAHLSRNGKRDEDS